jgi:cyclic dehypoxanthinyl futalosine synthase
MKTSCTMMFGHIETVAERIEHMRRLRDLQDETGGFTAFIHWPFQPAGTAARKWKGEPVAEPDGEHLCLASANEYLKMLAVARLFFDNIPNIQSSWVTMGPKIGQLALFYGANDMGSVMMEENVVSAAGTTYRLNEPEIRRLIEEAGWRPQQRDQYYRPINPQRPPAPAPVPGTPLPVVPGC